MQNRQLEILSNGIFANGELPKFADKIAEIGYNPLRPNKIGDTANQCRVYV